MYYLKAQTIHLEASPVLTVLNEQVSFDYLQNFYRRFWFRENLSATDPAYPHKLPMVLNGWEWLKKEIQRYIDSIILKT
jgi:hypothetical protein